MKCLLRSFLFLSAILGSSHAYSNDSFSQVAGLYNAILKHDSSNFYQHAKITLRTVNPEGQMKISANVRVFFGPDNSSEFLTYEFDEVPLNILTRQLAIKKIGRAHV